MRVSNGPGENLARPNNSHYLLCPLNRIAFVQNEKVVFDNKLLDGILNKLISQNELSESIQIAIITVLGSNKNKARTLHTEWIIRYHENKGNISSQTNYFGNEGIYTGNGMFVWPKLFKVEQKMSPKTKQVYCLLVYVNDDILLEKYAACISSKTFLFKGAEKDKFQNVFQSEELKPFLRNTNFIVASTGVMLVSKQKGLADIEKCFLDKFYKQREITPKRNFMDQLITSVNLGDHLEYVASLLNRLSGDKQENVCVQLNVVDQAFAQKDSSIITQISDGKQISKTDTNKKILGPCLRIQLNNLIENELNMDTVSSLTSNITFDQESTENIITAIQDILVSFNSDLKSMFANLVCFDDNDEHIQMDLLSQNAVKRLEHGYQNITANLADCGFNEDTLKVAHTKLINEYVSDNNKIVENEEILCSLVANQILNECKNVLFSMRKSEKTFKEAELDTIHRNVIDHAAKLMSRCLDYQGKSNSVLTKSIRNMETKMQAIFEEIAEAPSSPQQLLPRPPEKTIMIAFMDEFSKMEKHLEKYSTKDIIDFHEEWENKLCETISSADAKKEIKLKIDSRLIFFLEKRNELVEMSQIKQGQQNTLCINIKDEYIHATAILDSTIKPIWYSSENGSKSNNFPTRMALRKNTQKFYFAHQLDQFTKRDLDQNFIQCNISSFIANQHHERKVAMGVVTYFLSTIKNKACQQFQLNEFPQLIITVPSMFDRASRTLLREAATQQNFKLIFIYNESSLLAYHFITENIHKTINDLFVNITVGKTGVHIEIYEWLSNHNIQMVGLACEHWKADVYLGIEDNLPVEVLKTIKSNFEKAMDELPSSKSNKQKICFINHEKPSWTNSIKCIFHQADNTAVQMSFFSESEKANLVVKVLEKWVDNPLEIRSRILDYIAHFEETTAHSYSKEMVEL